jgi:MFS family permease
LSFHTNPYSNAAVIGNVELLLAILYPESLTSSIYTRLSNAFLIGMIVGMLMFGVVADQLGRKTGAVATTALLVLGIVLSTAAKGETETGMFWMLIIARGIAGVGAGGEYPVSGAGATEASDENKTMRKHRGFMFAMIADLSASLGYVFGGLVPLLLLLCVGQKKEHYDIVWRLSFALGLIPPVSIFWFRYKMAVSTAYRKASMRRQKVPYVLAIKRYWRPLLGASSTWFLYNWIAIVSHTARICARDDTDHIHSLLASSPAPSLTASMPATHSSPTWAGVSSSTASTFQAHSSAAIFRTRLAVARPWLLDLQCRPCWALSLVERTTRSCLSSLYS